MVMIMLTVLVLATSPIWAQEYNYPYKNPDVASLSVALMKSKGKGILGDVNLMNVANIAERNKTFLFEGRGQLRFGFYAQKQAAPLIFLIADIGGSPVSGYMMYEADLLYQNGFNVVTLASPFFWNFIVSSSRTGIPGMTNEDAADMYQAMQLALNKVKIEHRHPITKLGLIGFGFGALEAAHISAVDQREKKINIDRYLLINPVVNVIHAVTEIETRASIALELGRSQVEYLKAKAFNFVVDHLDLKFKVDAPAYFINLEQRFAVTEKDYKFLSGVILRMNIGDTIFASQLINNLKVLKSRLDRFHWNDRHKEIEAYGLVGYLQKIFVPFHSIKYPYLLNLIKHANFNYVRQEVRKNKNIFLMHNADDFIIDADQLAYLDKIFGAERSFIYPLGGHLGNLWYPQNQNDVIKVMTALK